MKGCNEVNQDKFILQNLPNQVTIGVVMDGHGTFGHNVTDLVEKKIQEWIDNILKPMIQFNKEYLSHELNLLFSNCHQVVNEHFMHNERGGTTLTIAIKCPDFVIVANVGDSLAFDIDEKKQLTKSHGVDSIEDYKRMKSNPYFNETEFLYHFEYEDEIISQPLYDDEDQIIPFNGSVVQYCNVRKNIPMYFCYPFGDDHDVAMINMLRSIGDLQAHRYGLTHKPTISIYPSNTRLFIASDGILDSWHFHELCEMIQLNVHNEDDCKKFFQHSVQRSVNLFSTSYVDDCTMVFML